VGGAAVDVSCLVDQVGIVHGRDDTDSQPDASSATVDFSFDSGDVALPAAVEIGATLDVDTLVRAPAVPDAVNLAANPSVETGTTGWWQQWFGSGGNGTTARTAGAGVKGGYAYRKTWTTASSNDADTGLSYSCNGITAGRFYAFRAMTRASKPSGMAARVRWHNSGGVPVGADIALPGWWEGDTTRPLFPANSVAQITGVLQAPAGAVNALLIWGVDSRGVAGAVSSWAVGATQDGDAVLVCEVASASSPVPEYFDGDTPDVWPFDYSWTGAAHNSTSRRTAMAGSYRRFHGRITDVALGWDDAGEDTPDRPVGQVLATGILADLGRRVVGAEPFPQELDGARVQRVLAAAGIPIDPLTQDPGTVQVLARDIDSQPALDVAQEAATSAMGVLWTTRAGKVCYADAEHRRNQQPQLVLDACDVLVTPTWKRTTQGLINDVSLGYGPPPEEGEQPRWLGVRDDSKARYGTYGYSLTTVLAALADAQALGQLLLTRNSSPVWVMAALPVDVANLDGDRTMTLLGMDLHGLVNLTGLPAVGSAPTTAMLWLEGITETLAYGVHDLELAVSGYCRTVPPPRWDDMPPSVTWDATPTAVNLATNPSLETGTAGWAAEWFGPGGNGTEVRTPGVGYRGSYAWRRTWTVGAADDDTGFVYTQTGIVAGRYYGFRAAARASKATGMAARVLWRDAGGAQVAQTFLPGWSGMDPARLTPANTWRDIFGVMQAPAGAVSVAWRFGAYSAGLPGTVARWVPGDTHDGDAVLIAEVPTATSPVPAYFDGDTADTADQNFYWLGTPHASTSAVGPLSVTQSTWDAAACLPPQPSLGRWADVSASLHWNQNAPSVTWDTWRG
jgi:hypothetical protein